MVEKTSQDLAWTQLTKDCGVSTVEKESRMSRIQKCFAILFRSEIKWKLFSASIKIFKKILEKYYLTQSQIGIKKRFWYGGKERWWKYQNKKWWVLCLRTPTEKNQKYLDLVWVYLINIYTRSTIHRPRWTSCTSKGWGPVDNYHSIAEVSL